VAPTLSCDPDFTTTYHLLGTGVNVTDFHIQDGLLCHLGHLCVPTSECAKMIWEAHYSRMAGHFGMEKTVVVLQKHFYWPKLRQDVNKYIISCTAVPFPSQPSRSKAYTPLFLLREALGIHLDGLHVWPSVHQA
jgi:hypothetical protein